MLHFGCTFNHTETYRTKTWSKKIKYGKARENIFVGLDLEKTVDKAL